MRDRVRKLSLKKGDVVFRPGQDCPGFVSLTRGTIKVSLTAANGREVVLYRVTPGAVCLQTMACLIEGRPYAAEGIAETDIEGELVPVAAFQDRLGTDADFRDTVFRSIVHRFAEFERLIEDVALTGFDARLARVLLRLADDTGQVTATHESLAAETASGRAFVSRRLAEMARLGLVEPGRGAVRILDRARLEQIAAEER